LRRTHPVNFLGESIIFNRSDAEVPSPTRSSLVD
jgi:hypothetical protein